MAPLNSKDYTLILNFINHQAHVLRSALNHISEAMLNAMIDQAAKQLKISLDDEDHAQIHKAISLAEEEIPPKKIKGEYRSPIVLNDHKTAVVTEVSIQRVTKLLNEIYGLLMTVIDTNLVLKIPRPELPLYLRPLITECLEERNIRLNSVEQLIMESMIIDEMVGFGPLGPLLADRTVTDILVNSPEKIYVERFGKLQESAAKFRDTTHIMHVISRIVSNVGRRIDISQPYVDARMEDGTRINVIIPPITLESPVLSIRKFSKDPILFDNMVIQGNLSALMIAVLTIAVRSRLNIIVSGGTGSGKTTLLNAISSAIPGNERIITIEDSAELKLQQEHVVRLETRGSNIDGRGVVDQSALLKNALRMRPDRIILGEVRGAEVFDVLQAMNTGHDGSMTTVHANRAEDVPMRLVDMLFMANIGLSHEACLSQISSIVDLIIHTSRLVDGTRRIMQISEIIGVEKHKAKLQHLFEYIYNFDQETGVIHGRFQTNPIVPKFLHKAAHFGFDKYLLELMGVST